MRQIRLTEYQKSDVAFQLSTSERDAIADAIKSITIEPAAKQAEHYFLPLLISRSQLRILPELLFWEKRGLQLKPCPFLLLITARRFSLFGERPLKEAGPIDLCNLSES